MTKQVTTLKIDNIDPNTLAKIQAILEAAGTEYTQQTHDVHTDGFDSLIGLDKNLMNSDQTKAATDDILAGVNLDAIKAARTSKKAPSILDGIL